MNRGISADQVSGVAGSLRLRYEPALDGLRAVAVLAVIAYHDAYVWARGGFLGVDAFFVLSGFLITTLLVQEEARTATVDLLAFWGRRLRRLLPALLLVLLAVAGYGAVEVSPYELAQLRGDALSSLFYVANWRFISTGASYFAVFSAPSPVRHLWSLAIEEQFYLFWPVVVLVCFALSRRGRRALLVVSLLGIVGSTLVMAALYDSADPSRAYFGTDARIHTILVGAVLAIALGTRPVQSPRARRVVSVAGVVGAVAVLWAMHSLSDVSSAYYYGGSLAFAIAVAAVIAAAMPPASGVVRTGLALMPLVWIGRISYGLYLWHWPVNVYLTEARTGVGGNPLNLVRLAVTFALATVSYFLVEMPIRRGAWRDRRARWLAPVVVACTGVVLVVATAGATSPPSYLGGDSVAAEGVAFRDRGAVAHLGIVECPSPKRSEKGSAEAATRRKGPPPTVPARGPVRVLVIGDSLGCSIAVGLEAAGRPALTIREATIVGCGVVSDQVFDTKEPFPRGTEICSRLAPAVEQTALDDFDPDVVLWVSTWERFNLVVGDALVRTGTPEWRAELQRRLQRAHRRLTAAGARLAITTVAAPAPASMLDGGRIVSDDFDWKFAAMNQELAGFVAAHPGTTLIDVAGRVCPTGPPCPLRVGGKEPRHGDGVHFHTPGSVWLGRWMLPQLVAAAGPAPATEGAGAPGAGRP